MRGCRLAQVPGPVPSSSGEPAAGDAADSLAGARAVAAGICPSASDAGGTAENAAPGQVADASRSEAEEPATQQGGTEGFLGASHHCMPSE